MKRILGWAVAILVVVAVPAVADGAACTGACWHTGQWSCGFTAFQEGGICQIVYDYWGYPAYCVIYTCPGGGGGGWVPENQGRLRPQELFPWEAPVAAEAADARVTVTVVEPRS